MVMLQGPAARAPDAEYHVAVEHVIGSLHKNAIVAQQTVSGDISNVVNFVSEYGVITPAIQPYPLR